MATEQKKLRFQMDTATFAHIWKNCISNEEKNDWRIFVAACFNRFSEKTETYNINTLNSDPDTEGWSNWEDTDKYQYLSDRCYAKCMSMRASVKKETGKELTLPDGYKSRNGTKASTRTTAADIANIFGL